MKLETYLALNSGRLRACEARCADLERALERYGHHDEKCEHWQRWFREDVACTCGFSEALAAAPTREEEPGEEPQDG